MPQVLDLFEIISDYDLDIMISRQDLNNITCRILEGIKSAFLSFKPDAVLVYGEIR
ncbi:MAG: hypothetical protein ACTS7E_04830 [Arsenophonus sp. NC-CH8-MAG3]